MGQKENDNDEITLDQWREVCLPVKLDNLSNRKAPTASTVPTAYALLISDVEQWPIPAKLQKKLQEAESRDRMIGCSISMTFYHAITKKLFGSTHVGYEHTIQISNAKEFHFPIKNFNEMMYFQSKINDRNCFAVIEFVLSLFDPLSGEVATRYGCGWTLIQPFGSGNDEENSQRNQTEHSSRLISSGKVPIFGGSPKELLTKKGDGKALLRQLKVYRLGNFYVSYKLWNFESLNKVIMASNIIQENQIVGAVTDIGGLGKTSVNFLDSRGSYEDNCIGAVASGNLLKWDLRPPDADAILLEAPTTLRVSDTILQIPKRNEFEQALVSYASVIPKKKTLSKVSNIFAWSKIKADGREETTNTAPTILSRKLKIGVHNGNSLLQNHWKIVDLHTDTEDVNILKSQKDIDISNYIMHYDCALVMLVEYTISSGATLQSPKKKPHNDEICIAIGASALCPFDGEKLALTLNDGHHGRGVALPIKADSRCISFSDSAVFSQNREAPMLKFCLTSESIATATPKIFECGQPKMSPTKEGIEAPTETPQRHDKTSLDNAAYSKSVDEESPQTSQGTSTITLDDSHINEIIKVPSRKIPKKELDTTELRHHVKAEPADKDCDDYNETLSQPATETPERVYALNLLESSDELRFLADFIRGVDRKEGNPLHCFTANQAGEGGSLREQQLHAVKEHLHRQHNSTASEMRSVEKFLCDVTPSHGAFDVEFRVLTAVQWYREAKKKERLLNHVQGLNKKATE